MIYLSLAMNKIILAQQFHQPSIAFSSAFGVNISAAINVLQSSHSKTTPPIAHNATAVNATSVTAVNVP